MSETAMPPTDSPGPIEGSGRSPAVATSLPWGPWLAVFLVVAVYFASQFAAGLLLSIYPTLHHWREAQAIKWLTDSVAAQFLYVLLAESFAVGAIYLFMRRRRRSLADIGLKRPQSRDVVYALLAAPLYYAAYLLSASILGYFVPGLNVNQQQDIGFTHVQGSVPLLLTFISLVILPPIAEEILMRGFLYTSLKKAMPVVWAALLTSAIFAAAHLPEGGSGGPLYIAGIDTFVLSLVLVYLREKTGSLWASITLHAIKNGVAFAALYLIR